MRVAGLSGETAKMRSSLQKCVCFFAGTRPSCYCAGRQPIKKGGNRPPLGGTEAQRRESNRAAPVLTGDAASAVPWCTPASLKHAAGRSDAVPAAPNLRGVLAAAQRRSEQLLPALRIAPSREYL